MSKVPIPEVFEGKPVVTAAQARALDQRATTEFGIPEADLMERAGEAVAAQALAMLGGALGKKVVVCGGRGANGGDGLVAARHLSGAGASVRVFICGVKKDGGYPPLVAANLDRAKQAGVAVIETGEHSGLDASLNDCDLVLDALLGTGSSGKPAGAIHHMIQEITRSQKTVLAVDVPSGLQPDTGYHSGVFIAAAVTVTFGWAKRGLLATHAQKNVGRLIVADIGYPETLKPAL